MNETKKRHARKQPKINSLILGCHKKIIYKLCFVYIEKQINKHFELIRVLYKYILY